MKYILVVIAIIFYFAQLTKADEINDNVTKTKEVGSRVKRQIHGGEKAEHARFPYLVYLRRNGWNKPNWLPALVRFLPFIGDWFSTPFHCGGVIIHKHFVLTAAHCITGNVKSEVKRLEIVAGTNQLKNPVSKDVKAHAVEAIAVHTVPNGIHLSGDIAVIKVKSPFEYGPHISRAKLPPSNYKLTPNTLVAIGGWGLTENHDEPLDLHYLYTRVTYMEVCKAAWKAFIQTKYPLVAEGLDFDKIVERETMMCVSGLEGQGACSGDSGGGAVTSDRTVLGIVSFGATPCGNSRIIPDVLTYVPHYIPWIKQQMIAMIK